MWFEKQGVEMKIEVCEYGHIQSFYVPVEERREARKCLVCGSSTMVACPKCGGPLGRRVGSGFAPMVWESDLTPPLHCLGCGATMPWRLKRGRGAERLGAARALVRRHVKFKAAYAARITSNFATGLLGATSVLAGRMSRTASSTRALLDDHCVVDVGSTTASMDIVGSKWICDCPDFVGDAARCRHAWTITLLGKIRPLGRRLGATGELLGATDKPDSRSAVIRKTMRGFAASPERFEEEALVRIGSAWRRCLEWESSSNRDIELSAGMADADPEFAMYLAQQAVEKQIKSMEVYFAAFDDAFSPKSLRHDIFADGFGKDFLELLDEHCLEIQKMTMGIMTDPSKSGVIRHMGKTPSLLANGPDIDDNSALSGPPEKLTLEWCYKYIQRRLRPLQYQPRELRCPRRECVSDAPWGRFDYGRGVDAFSSQWSTDAGKYMDDFILGSWRWRYYALYVHKEARYPSEFSPVYRQNACIAKRWIFEAGFMTSSLQDAMRKCYAIHTYEEGDRFSRRLEPVRDRSWYGNQIWLLTGNEHWRPDGHAQHAGARV